MKKSVPLSILFLLILTAASAQINKVLLIGIDGCRSDALQVANTPNIDALANNGTYSYDAMNDGITISGPGWASLLTGVWPNKHGITNNTFVGYDLFSYPHLFKRIEDHDSNINTVSICQWGPINTFITLTHADVSVNVQDHSTYVEDEAVYQLSNGDPDAIFLHFDDVDHAGHGSGFSPTNPDYITAIETVDNSIGGVIAALNNRPDIANENWVIIVSTDHGGIGTSHGGDSFEERHIFLIVSGNSVDNLEVSADSSLTTVLPTPNCLGDSVQLYFDGNDVVSTAVNSAFDFGTSQDFTIECRVRTATSGDFAIVTDKDWDSGYNPGWVFSFNASGGPWKVNVGDGSARVDIEGNDISDNQWHTLSATFDRDGDLTLYEDGIEVNSGPLSSIGSITTGLPICMGADPENDYFFTGHIAEVRVFNSLVSANDINAWRCAPLNNTHPNYSDMVGYWRADDGGGSNTLVDHSTTQAHGTINGATWESATDTLLLWEYDYSNTPKQVDYMVSALRHLCVPIDPAWNLDGQVFGTTCSEPVSVAEHNHEAPVVVSHFQKQIKVSARTEGTFVLMDCAGRVLHQADIAENIYSVDVTDYPSGPYIYRFMDIDANQTCGKILISN